MNELCIFRKKIPAPLILAAVLFSLPVIGHSTAAEDKASLAVSQGISLYRQGSLMAARSEFKKALRLNPNEKKAQLYLERIDRKFRLTAEALLRLAQKTREKSERELDRILRSHPDGPAASRLLYRA